MASDEFVRCAMSELLPEKWQVVDENLVFDCNIFKLCRECCVHPLDGRTGEFFILHPPDWVQVIALTQERNIVLVKQFRFGTRRLSLEIPGGIIEPGEDPVMAAERELLEETGFSGENASVLKIIYPNPAIQDNKLYTVFIENCRLVGKQSLDPLEEITFLTIPIHRLWEKIRSGEIDHGVVLAALFFLKLRLEEE
ncbi:MAG: NUDIX hydrolase [Puniceicoccales bacterium]|jgi:8-oxo-dGTP pyrophosphatase MutT (NUDIX family)|nr:NUDIX hydrolase [Puniceicoccales bacterium]